MLRRTLVTPCEVKPWLVSNNGACKDVENLVYRFFNELNAHALLFAAAIINLTLYRKRSVLDAGSCK